MKISAVNSNVHVYNRGRLPQKTVEESIVTANQVKLSFKGGNPNDVLHVVAEGDPFAKVGGVGTVVKDYYSLKNGSSTEAGRSVFVLPYYNGNVKYNANGMRDGVELVKVPHNLPLGHKLIGHEGEPVFVKKDLGSTSILDALTSGDYWLLKEVESKTMSWGLEENAPIKLLRVVSDKNGAEPKHPSFFVFSEATAFDPEPYSDGSYSSSKKAAVNSWGGSAYAKYDKAVVELMPAISKDLGNGFDPGSVVCSDSQAAFVTHYMARENAKGNEYFKGKKPIQIGHNLGDGYIGITSPRNMLVNLDLMTAKELKALSESPEFLKALAAGDVEESKFYQQFFKGFDAGNKMSAMSVPMHYGKNGYLQTFAVVSQGYLDEIVVNDEIAPYLFEDFKTLYEKGVAVGHTNPLNSAPTAFSNVGVNGYKFDVEIAFKDGSKTVIPAMEMLKPEEKETLSLEKVKELKKKAKLNFLERFLPKYNNENISSIKFFENSKTWKNGDLSLLQAGLAGKDFSIPTELDAQKYIDAIKKGEDVKIVVSWGRGDFQKALDEVINGFKKYVKNTGDKNTLLVLGGDLSNDKVEGQKVKDLAELVAKDPDLKGRIMLMDGFAPGNPMAWMGDVALFPSRTAPCELTDLEAKGYFCTPIVPNGQGMKQKNYDPTNPEEWEKADAYKTKHQYFSKREDMLEVASEETKTKFNKVYNQSVKTIQLRNKTKLGAELSQEELESVLKGRKAPLDKKCINAVENYQEALRKLRDEVMTDELAAKLNEALHPTTKTETQIFKNHLNMKTGWEENQRIAGTKVSTAELYRKAFHKDPHNLNEQNIIGYGINRPQINTKPENKSLWQGIKKFAGKKGGRWTIGLTLTAALVGTGFALSRKKDSQDVKDSDNLALIG